MMDLSLPVMKISHFNPKKKKIQNEKKKDEDFIESTTFLEPKPRLGLESEQRIRNKISFELNETALDAASVINILLLLCYQIR